MNEFLLAREVRGQLEHVHQLLLDNPGKFSTVTAGAALESVAEGLTALQKAISAQTQVSPDTRLELSGLFAMSRRVNALYRQASEFYGAIAPPAYPLRDDTAPNLGAHTLQMDA
jgi:hypothetical protein